MSLALVPFHRYRLKKNGIQEITDENVGASQKKSVKSKFNKSELIQKLKIDPIIGKMKMTETENGILLETGMTWKSWREKSKINLKDYEGNDFEYQITSRPRLKITLVDYGKNIENSNRIENLIKITA